MSKRVSKVFLGEKMTPPLFLAHFYPIFDHFWANFHIVGLFGLKNHLKYWFSIQFHIMALLKSILNCLRVMRRPSQLKLGPTNLRRSQFLTNLDHLLLYKP